MVESSGIGLAFSSFAQGREDARAARNSGGGGYNIALTDKLLAEIRENRDKNGAMYEAAVAQREALIVALTAVAPNHPLLQNSELKFKDGQPKTQLRLVFEEAFDKDIKALGGVYAANPKAFRRD